MAFSPDGRRLAAGMEDGTVRLWYAGWGEPDAVLERHGGRVWTLAFSPDGERLVSGGRDRTIRLWDVATREEVARLEGHRGLVRSVAFSPDDIASGDEIAVLEPAEDRRPGRRGEGQGGRRSVRDDTAMELEVGMAPGFLCLAFSSDGRRVAAGSAHRNVSVWDVASGEEIAHFLGHTGRVWAVALSPDGTRVASGSDDRTIRIRDIAAGEEVALLETGSAVWSVDFSPDGARLAAASEIDTIRLWDVASGEEIARLRGHTGRVLSVAFNPDGSLLASSSEDQTIRLWDLTSGAETADDDRSAYFERAPAVDSIYRASLYLLGYRLDGAELEPSPRPQFLTPVDGYRFPERRGYWKLDRPRPPGTDPIAWMVEAMEASGR